MKKISVAFAFMVASMSAFAGSATLSEQEQTGIITPDIATGVYRTYSYTYDKDMNLLICPHGMDFKINYKTNIPTCLDKNDKSQWKKMENYIPAGKKFVGFKSVSAGASHAIEIYWK